MISCPVGLEWSESRARQRQEAACKVLGPAVVARIIGYALFLLGLKRQQAAERIGVPLNTVLSFLTRMTTYGLDGLRDRRERASEAPPSRTLRVRCEQRGEKLALRFLETQSELLVPVDNIVQKRVIVLTLLQSGLLSTREAAETLGLSCGYVRNLQRRLTEGDAAALIDGRSGQQVDYRVDEALKGELILRWASRAATGKGCSSRTLAGELHDHNGVKVSDRTIRHHLKKLGLIGMAATLHQLVEDIKKGS